MLMLARKDEIVFERTDLQLRKRSDYCTKNRMYKKKTHIEDQVFLSEFY